MGLWTIEGGNPLYGTIRVQGSKNAALPILTATLVHKGVSVLERVPRVGEIEETLELLQRLNCKVMRTGETVTVDSRNAALWTAETMPRELHRASVLFLGAMLARFGEARIPMPVGCRLGPRPMDLHIAALEKLGAEFSLEDCCVACRADRLQGGEVLLPYPSVGASENAMLAACGCAEDTVIRNCAAEPEVEALAAYLNSCGMQIRGAGTDTVFVKGRHMIGTVRYMLPPDRIAASTLLCAVAGCGGKVTLQEVNCTHFKPILDGLGEMGCNIKIRETSVTIESDGRLWAPCDVIETGAYPAFPTDALPGMLAACLKADGVTTVRERVVPGRLQAVKQLRRFGGDVTITEDCTAYVTGVTALYGADVRGRDVYGSAGLLVGALQANGISRIVDDGNICRGYEYPDAVLRQLGANVNFTA